MERIFQISTALLCLLVAVLADPPANVNQLSREMNQAAASAIRNAQAAFDNSLKSAQLGSSAGVSCSSDAHGNNNCQKKTMDALGHTNIVNMSNSGAVAASIHSVVSILSFYLISCLL